MTSWSEALQGTGVDAGKVLERFSAIVHDLAPKNRALLAKRERSAGRRSTAGTEPMAKPIDLDAYKYFLQEIGYLRAGRSGVRVRRSPMSIPRSPSLAGPQLVVPVINARYALNAANARWGSLYDALYGTDAIPETAAPARQELQSGARRQGDRLGQGFPRRGRCR
ncbi:MAG: hypothetical protein QM729_13215 [Solirubrobacterales bacterium]